MTTLTPLLEALFLDRLLRQQQASPNTSLLIATLFASSSPSPKNISSKHPPRYSSPISMLLSLPRFSITWKRNGTIASELATLASPPSTPFSASSR